MEADGHRFSSDQVNWYLRDQVRHWLSNLASAIHVVPMIVDVWFMARHAVLLVLLPYARSHHRDEHRAGVLDRYCAAMRIMGHPPMRIAEFDRYLGELSTAKVDQFRIGIIMPDSVREFRCGRRLWSESNATRSSSRWTRHFGTTATGRCSMHASVWSRPPMKLGDRSIASRSRLRH